MATLPTVQAACVASLLLPRLTDLLRNPSMQVQECAVLILRCLVESSAHRDAVLYLGLTEELFKFIQTCNVQSREHAAVIIKNSMFRRAAGADDEIRRQKFSAAPVELETFEPQADEVQSIADLKPDYVPANVSTANTARTSSGGSASSLTARRRALHKIHALDDGSSVGTRSSSRTRTSPEKKLLPPVRANAGTTSSRSVTAAVPQVY